jgi:hypothetical protein
MTSYAYDEFTTEEYGDLISQYDGADTLFHQYDGLGSITTVRRTVNSATGSAGVVAVPQGTWQAEDASRLMCEPVRPSATC